MDTIDIAHSHRWYDETAIGQTLVALDDAPSMRPPSGPRTSPYLGGATVKQLQSTACG